MGISILAWLSSLDPYGGLGMITRPIWKCPCINLYVLDDKEKFLLVKFRTLNHRLPIEVGRWRNIIRENRICNLCNGRNLGDEFHYLFECPSLSNERKKYLESHFINRPNILKLCNLMNSKSVSVLCNIDLNTKVDFSDFIFVKIYNKFDVRKKKCLNHQKIKAI